MKPEASLPHSQMPATSPYPEPAWSSPFPHIPLPEHQSISPGTRLTLWIYRNRILFYGEELLAHNPTPKLKDHPLSAVRYRLFNIFAAVPPSATWVRAMPWWQRPTYHGAICYKVNIREVVIRSLAGSSEFSPSECPERCWNPPSLQFHGCLVLFRWGKALGAAKLTTHAI
jgi:hypothetical protein